MEVEVEVMQSGAGAAAAGRGHQLPRCCHSRSVLTQTRDTDRWQSRNTRIQSHLRVIILYYYSILILQTDWQYSAIQLVCHLLPNLRRNKLEGRRKMPLKIELAFHSDLLSLTLER